MVLLDEAHDGVSEVSHVLAHHEGKVTSLDLLVVDNVVTNLITSPLGVSEVS